MNICGKRIFEGKEKMRILIVEDEVKIRVGISRLITSHTQHTVVGEAKNGKEGLEMISRYHPQLVISDIRMPVMDGLEMLQESIKTGKSLSFCDFKWIFRV